VLNRRAFVLTVFVLLALLPPVAQLLGYPFYVKIGTRIIIWSIAALSLGLVLNWGGMVSLVHAAFMGVAAYVVGLLAWHATNSEPIALLGLTIAGSTSALVVWPLALAGAALAAFVIGGLSLRTSGLYFIMITLAFGQMLYYFTVALQKYGGDDGTAVVRSMLPLGINLANPLHLYYFAFALLIAAYAVVVRIVRSPFGMVVQAARQNDRRARAVGFPSYRYKLACFTVSGALGGMAGILFVNMEAYISPAALHWTRSAELVIMVLLGGMGSLIGPIVGAASFIILEVVLSSWTNYWQAILGPLLIVIVLLNKRGNQPAAHD
jgi:branched-chain amino acid transport system permease protein